jgi:MOSC domain-containing protein YiiM
MMHFDGGFVSESETRDDAGAPAGTVEQILIAAGPKGTPRDAVDSVVVVEGMGLMGDRYFGQKPGKYAADRQVTLIEAEAVEAVREGGVAFTAADARRNVVTRGVRLNALVGRTFRVGGAVLRGVELCHPCGHLAKLTYRGVTRDLKMRGGLRAEVLHGGEIRIGDALAEV